MIKVSAEAHMVEAQECNTGYEDTVDVVNTNVSKKAHHLHAIRCTYVVMVIFYPQHVT